MIVGMGAVARLSWNDLATKWAKGKGGGGYFVLHKIGDV